MTEPTLGNNIVTQVGIIVRDIASTARAWSEILGLPVPNIVITETMDKTHAEYSGKSTTARAKLAFFYMGSWMSNSSSQSMDPAHGKTNSINTAIVCTILPSKLKACRKKLHIWIQKVYHFYSAGNIPADDMRILMASPNWERFWNSWKTMVENGFC